jgi:hypothetical protein
MGLERNVVEESILGVEFGTLDLKWHYQDLTSLRSGVCNTNRLAGKGNDTEREGYDLLRTNVSPGCQKTVKFGKFVNSDRVISTTIQTVEGLNPVGHSLFEVQSAMLARRNFVYRQSGAATLHLSN